MEQIVLKKNSILKLEIIDIAFGGKGIAKVPTEQGNFTLFIPNTIKGQIVEARIVKKRKQHAECKLVKVITPSPLEIHSPYQTISGAPYASLPIEHQKDFKERNVFHQFEKIALVPNIKELYEGYIHAPSSFHYRNKMEYAFSAIGFEVETQTEFDGFALGFKKRGTWWCVENLNNDSGLFDKEFESKLHQVREYLIQTGLPAWHPPKKEGFFRYLVVRKSFIHNKILLKLVTSSDGMESFDLMNFSNFINKLYPGKIAGVLHTINDDIGDNAQSRMGGDTLISGNAIIEEQLLGLNFEISMQSFFQTNPQSAALLYQKVIDWVLLENKNLNENHQYIFDLFCGTGTIAQLIAKHTATPIIGVDIVPEAIENAKSNAKKNELSNVTFHAANVNNFLMNYPEYAGKIQTIVLDPPRAGIAKKALKRVLELAAPRIVYVSCNPSTQARDTLELKDAGYELKKFTLVDQFPHTSHIESIGLFEKKS